MALRDITARLFEKRKERPRQAWDSANMSRDDKLRASGEREQQLREFDKQKAESFPRDVNKERQKLSLQHPDPVLTPDLTKKTRTAWQLENQAQKNVIAMNERLKEEIRQKPDRVLLADAVTREASRAGQAQDKASDQDRERSQDSAHLPTDVRERPDAKTAAKDASPEPTGPEPETHIEAGGINPAELTAAPAAEPAIQPWTAKERAAAMLAEEVRQAALEADHSHDLDPGLELSP